MKLAHTFGHANHRRATTNAGLQASTPGQYGSYFPNSRVAAGGTSYVSPPSYDGDGPGLQPTDIVTLPRGGESPWIVSVPSDEQGVGRSPGFQWPTMQVAQAMNLSQIDIMPFEFDQVYVDGFPDARTGVFRVGRERPEQVGWSMPRYYETMEGYATDPNSIGVTPDPQSQAYTIAWGAIDDGSQAYGQM